MTDTANKLLIGADLPFTAGHLRWLANGGKFTEEAFDRISSIMVKDFFHTDRSDGSGRLRASGFSLVGSSYGEHCQRRQILSFLGVGQDESDTASYEMMNTGTFLHYYYQLAGLSEGWLADVEVPVVYQPWKLRGSADGLLTDGTGLEIKTTGGIIYSKIAKKHKELDEKARKQKADGLSDEGFELWRAASLSHLWQVHMYMQAMDVDKFSIVYIDRGFPQNFTEIRVPRNEEILDAIHKEMEELGDYIAIGELPPMLPDCTRFTGRTFERCNYRTACPKLTDLDAELLFEVVK